MHQHNLPKIKRKKNDIFNFHLKTFDMKSKAAASHLRFISM